MEFRIFKGCIGFDWDAGNQTKSQQKHHVVWWECEQIFFNSPLLVYEDEKHSRHEQRFYVLGKTDFERKLFVVFTIRGKLIRVISARDMHTKEHKVYEKV